MVMMNTAHHEKELNETIGQALIKEVNHLKKTAFWCTGDPIEAEDLLQDTVVLALRFCRSYQKGTNLRAWLVRVMRNRHISITRRKKVERLALETEGRHALKDWSIGEMGQRSMEHGGGVEKDTGLSDQIAQAMDNLRPEFREAIWLCDIEGLSYAEAAQRTSRPVGTIMSRLHRGRRALRNRLGSRRELEAA